VVGHAAARVSADTELLEYICNENNKYFEIIPRRRSETRDEKSDERRLGRAIALVGLATAGTDGAVVEGADEGYSPDRRWQAEPLGPGTALGRWEAGSVRALATGRDSHRRTSPPNLPPGSVPFQPWAEKLYKERRANDGRDDPTASCIVGGVPRSDAVPYPFKILHEKNLVVILYEAVHSYRQIFADGRSLPEDMNPSWFGYSIGRWDKDTFVVETAGFNDKGWLDNWGKPATDKLRVTEKFVRKDFGHMDILITIRRSGRLHEAMGCRAALDSQAGHRAARIHLQREQQVLSRFCLRPKRNRTLVIWRLLIVDLLLIADCRLEI
jgi:hypothetical protein